jgi:GT2 family glycosyltransferase
MDVSIIYVNWNSEDFIKESIESVYEHTRGLECEIIVVDNASPRGNVDILKQHFPQITLIKSAKNLGFAGANNVGFQNSSGEYILFLNPDTKLVNPAINMMLRRLRELPDAGIMGCKLLDADLAVRTDSIQTFPTILNQVLDANVLRDRWPHNPLWGIGPLYSESVEPVQVEVISGACLMIKRAAFEKVLMFSEEYFMYAEDLDLCYKVAHAGYKNYYAGEGRVIHYGGKSSEPESATRMKWRAIPRFCDKNRGRIYGLAFRAVLAMTAMFRLAAIKVACAFGDKFGQPAELRHSFRKWRIILNVLLTPSIPN